MNSLTDRIATNGLDGLLARVSILLSASVAVYAITEKGRLVYALVGILVLVVSSAWLYLHGKPLTANPRRFRNPRSARLALATLFVVFFTLSIASVHLSPDPYVRPQTYFVFTTLMVSLIFAEILVQPPGRLLTCLALAQIVTVGLSLEITQTLAFPNLVGVDPWWHRWFVTQILGLGHIPANYPYTAFPVFHLEIVSTMLGTGLDYKLATISSIVFLLNVLNSSFAYLIGRILFNEKLGLIAALALSVGSFNLLMGFWTIPNTLGIPIVLLCTYLLIRPAVTGVLKLRGAVVVLMVILILTHPIATAMMALILVVGWAAYFSLRRKLRTAVLGRPVSATLTLLFGVGMFGWWAYASGDALTEIANIVKFGFSLDAFVNAPPETLAFAGSVPIAEQILAYLGPMLFFSISLIGAFAMISRRLGNRRRGFIAVAGGAVAGIPFFSLLTGHSVIEGRWWFLAMAFLSIPLALSFVIITQLGRSGHVPAFCAVCALTTITFLLITSPIANIDNGGVYHNSSVRAALTAGEVDSATTAYRLFHRTIVTDEYYSSRIQFLGVDTSQLSSELYAGKFNQTNRMIMIRAEITENPFYIFSSVSWELPYNPVAALDGQVAFSRVFDSGAAVGYLSPGDRLG